MTAFFLLVVKVGLVAIKLDCIYLSINLFRVQFEMIQWNVVTLVVDKLINLFVARLPCTLHKDF